MNRGRFQTNCFPEHVILRSPALWHDEGSPQFAGKIHRLAIQRNYRDSSAGKNGGLRMTRAGFFVVGSTYRREAVE